MMRGRWWTVVVAVLTIAAADADFTFAYKYPPQAAAIAPLKAWMDRQAAAARTETAAMALADRREAAKNGLAFNRWDTDRRWQVVADLPRFLSLSLTRFDYTGGAHGNTGYAALVWDRQRQLRMRPADFFTSDAALRPALRAGFCAQLDRERRRRRNGVLDDGVALDTACPDPTGETLILGSADHRHFTRLGFLIAPYDAGPYVEGNYEVTLPVTPAMIAAVRPEFRAYFATGTP